MMSKAMKEMYKEAWGILWFVFYYTYKFLNYLRWRSEELSENVFDITAEREQRKRIEKLYPNYKLAEEMAKDFEERSNQ
jgi:hypothetical protein